MNKFNKIKFLSRQAFLIINLCLFAMISYPVSAHHPGTELDEVMGDRERYFQKIDKPAPSFILYGEKGDPVHLNDFTDKVVILHFVYTSCLDVCPLHAERIAEIQAMINISPIKEMVQIISITTDPTQDTIPVLKSFGEDHGLDPVNWMFLTNNQDQNEDITRKLAQSFGHKFKKMDDGYQAHGVVTHVIDRNGRLAANFHGLRFDPVNLVLYVSGLINNIDNHPKNINEGWIDKIINLFQ